ncbi:hypothetical protein RH915_09595 [Serpentinicella sp. ANB-PHB4]|uniref:hypothetical protein n=1 Tax=Serpentinicella sp. ANB-PHB4 TaxID=3074076 RepID=UPI002862A7BC|nr:hypothetical protein [Serpentinicella sp. ANB-PHB4]MDR5659749.1 hypothetical protein [Serpentinicella sp. ANB-PHB4]
MESWKVERQNQGSSSLINDNEEPWFILIFKKVVEANSFAEWWKVGKWKKF